MRCLINPPLKWESSRISADDMEVAIEKGAALMSQSGKSGQSLGATYSWPR